jgi:outer membrane protein assembly factor BamB
LFKFHVKKRTALISALVAALLIGLIPWPGSAFAHIERAFGEPENLGAIVTSVASLDTAYGTENGHDVMYTTVSGPPALFHVIDLDTYEVLRTYPLEGVHKSWTHVVDASGNVYIGGTKNLYRYSPLEQTLTDLGTAIPGAGQIFGLSVDEQGRIYGGTYPDAHVFRYDPADGSFHDYGSVVADQAYVRSLTYYNGTLYAGIGARGSIIAIDAETGEKNPVDIPDRPEYYNVNELGYVYGMNVAGPYLFVYVSGDKVLLVYDLERQEWLPETYTDYNGMYTSPEHNGKTYFFANNKVMAFDLATKTVTDTGLVFGSYMRQSGWVTLENDSDFPGESLVTISYSGQVTVFNFETSKQKTLPPILHGQPVAIQALEKGADGKLYMSGYMGTYAAKYDPATGEKTLFPLGQAEGMASLGDKMYMGIYSGALIYELDTAQELQQDVNPKQIFSLREYKQDRPFAMTSGDGKVYIGTVPTYGELGGALAIHNPQTAGTDRWEVYTDIVTDQSIIGLTYRDGKLYGSTSVWGGLGSEPTQTEARIFVWDIDQQRKVAEFTPSLPVAEVPKAIGNLSFGPDGLLWGAAKGTIFALDPNSYEVVKSKEVYPSNWNVDHYWRPVHLRWGEDGYLYTTLGAKVTVVDPESMETVPLQTSALMTLGDDGHIYYTEGPNLMRIQVAEGTPPPEIVEYEVPLSNPGFEAPVTDGSILGWTVQSSSPNAQAAVTNEKSSSGQFSLKLEDKSTAEKVEVISDPVPVIPGKEYTARTKLFLEEGRTIYSLLFYDEAGNMIKQHVAYATGNRGVWQELEIRQIAPDNADSLKLMAHLTKFWMAKAYYDDVRISVFMEMDTTPPMAPIVVLPERPWSTNQRNPIIVAKGERGAELRVLEGDQVVGTARGMGDDEIGIELNNLSQGIHKLTLIAVDLAGNVSAETQIPHIIINNGKKPE